MKVKRVSTVTGKLAYSPELRFTPWGREVTSFRLEGDPRFFQVWNESGVQFAENIAEGDMVTLTGSEREETWEAREGHKVVRVFTVDSWKLES